MNCGSCLRCGRAGARIPQELRELVASAVPQPVWVGCSGRPARKFAKKCLTATERRPLAMRAAHRVAVVPCWHRSSAGGPEMKVDGVMLASPVRDLQTTCYSVNGPALAGLARNG